MIQQNFSTTVTVDQSPQEVFEAINNVRGWWSGEIEGPTAALHDEFSYRYQDVHRCRIKITESVPGRRVTWEVLDNYFSFTSDSKEWTGTHVIFDISTEAGKTVLRFTHEGLTPQDECYEACVNGWTHYISSSLPELIRTGQGQPNASDKAYTPHEVAARFHELAQQEKWFEIQDELFADHVKSIEPEGSPFFANAEGREAVRKKGTDFVSRIEELYRAHTTAPVVGGRFFAVGRETDISLRDTGRVRINQVMLYEVQDGKIISEQFSY